MDDSDDECEGRNRDDEHPMPPEEIEILAPVKRALGWLSVDPRGNSKSDVHWFGPPFTPVRAAHQNRSGGYAAGRSTERWSVTGTAGPLIVSRTRPRPPASGRRRGATKTANSPAKERNAFPT